MKELEILLNKRWILKSRDKETYYKLRDALGELRKFTTEKMGCQIIDNSLLIKMEKIPVIPESFMGIQKFSSKEEYAYLCILLMFLEDRDAQEQFIISQLTEYITANLPGEISDWTLYTNRRKLIRVMRFAADQGLIGVTDGKDEAFMDDEGGEVLYENTGASRYFMKSFSKDIMEYTKPEDFQESDWFEVDEDRGFARRHRVYKRLIFAPGMYKADGSSEDFEYLKYYGRRLSEELEQIFDCHVHIHKGSAYLLSGDDCRMGTVFPGNNSISDILLLCFREIRKKIESVSSSSSSLSGSYRWARVSISSRSRNSSRTCASIWSKSADSPVGPDRLVLCLLVFCLLVFCCVAFSKLGSAKFGKSKNGEEQGFMRLFGLLVADGFDGSPSLPGTAGASSTGDS